MAGKSRQRGISFITLIFLVAVLGGIGAMVMQVLPSFIEYEACVKAINRAKDEVTVQGVRLAFDRSTQVDNITSISGKDLEVTKEGDRVVVSFAYQKEFHMFGPAYLLMKYSATSRAGR